MEAAKERREAAAAAEGAAGDGEVQLPTETSPYVRYNKDDGLEDYKMRAYGARGHLPVSDVPRGGTGTDAPTVPGTAVPPPPAQPDRRAGGGGVAGVDTATDAISRHGVP